MSATEGYGAKVVLYGDCYDDAYKKAVEIQEKEGATFLHPYDDLEVMAGQGTIGIEILEDLPTVDMVLVQRSFWRCCCLQSKSIACGIVQPSAPSFKEKKHVTTDSAVTIADGIAVKIPGDKTVELINKYADDVVTVSDAEISEAILLLLERTKQVVEPAGATPLAAVLNNKVDVKGKKIACVLSGGNIDVSFIHRIIELGLVTRERKLKFKTTLLDIPGSLEHLSHILAEANANIVMVQHDRLSADLDPNEAIIHIACEVGGREHGERVIKVLEKNGYNIVME